jgi:DNA-directed RNA polymerase specialized sigma24 family protein
MAAGLEMRMPIRIPTVSRVPVTNENLMVDAGKGDGDALAEFPFLQELLYERIVGLVRNLSFKYTANSINEFEDLVQDCLTRIWSSRRTFDPNKGCVSTWVWRVCSSVLNSDFAKSKKYKGKLKFWSQVSKEETGDITETDEVFCADDMSVDKQVSLRMAIEELYRRHGKNAVRKGMLDALFCIEEDGVFVASAHRAAFRMAFPGVAFTVDLPPEEKVRLQKKSGELMRFIRAFVRPVMEKHMGEE